VVRIAFLIVAEDLSADNEEPFLSRRWRQCLERSA